MIEHNEAFRLCNVLSDNRCSARDIASQCDDIAAAYARLGQRALAAEIGSIGDRVVAMADAAYRAHGAMIAEQGRNTASEISGIITACIGGDA